jgi:hypothetical protein
MTECKEYAKPSGSTVWKGAFLGPFAGVAMDDAEYKHSHTDTSELIDQCLKKKGYKIIDG